MGLNAADMAGYVEHAPVSQTQQLLADQSNDTPPPPLPYEPLPGEHCYSIGCSNECDPTKECPTCLKKGIRTFFCSSECFKSGWVSHKKMHRVGADSLARLCTWGLARPMAAEVLTETCVGDITAVASLANTDELVAVMALKKNEFDVSQAVMRE
jgi:hypothetical protein